MLNLALVAVLSGSLFMAPGDDCKKQRTCERDQAPIALEATDDVHSITGDTYAFGRPATSAPIKLWVEFGRGTTEEQYNAAGAVEPLTVSGVPGFKVTSMRVAVGTQINVVNTPSFQFGVGGQLNIAKDEFELGGTAFTETAFGIQGAKIFGALHGRVLGVHGGYFLDLASEPNAMELRTSSDQRNAIFFGGDFDYPSERFRLFGGVDYFMPQEDPVVSCVATSPTDLCGSTSTETDTASDNILMFTMGAGLRFSVFEIGAAMLLRAQDDRGLDPALDSGGHVGTVAPYLRISPPSVPVSLFVQGAVAREYTDYGYNISGGNDLVSGFGFTAGLTIGFE